MRNRKTMVEILDEIAELHSLEEREHVLKHVLQQLPASPVGELIDALNEELISLYMPYTIEDLINLHPVVTWIVKDDTNPKKLNFRETLYPSERSTAIYNLLLEPFKDANVIYPTTLAMLADLLKIDLTDDWKVSFVRDWLIGLNVSFYPNECQGIIKKLIKMSAHYTEN